MRKLLPIITLLALLLLVLLSRPAALYAASEGAIDFGGLKTEQAAEDDNKAVLRKERSIKLWDIAAKCKDPEEIRELIRGGADMGYSPKNNVNNDGFTAFLKACNHNPNPDIINVFIKAGVDLNGITARKNNALLLAAFNPNPEIVKILLAAGANPNARIGESSTVLIRVVEQRKPEVVKILLAAGADINRRRGDETGCTALLMTVIMTSTSNGGIHRDEVEILKILLAAGANPNDATYGGTTALEFADSPEIKRILIDAGARR